MWCWRGALVSASRQLHEQFTQFIHLIFMLRYTAVLTLLYEIPQTHRIKKLKTKWVSALLQAHPITVVEFYNCIYILYVYDVCAYPDAALSAELFAWFVGFCPCPIGVGVHVETLSSKWTRSSTLIKVFTRLLTARHMLEYITRQIPVHTDKTNTFST